MALFYREKSTNQTNNTMKSNFWKEGKFTTIIGAALVAAGQAAMQYPILSSVLTCIGGALVASKDPKIFV
jgi:hypothetical protein